MKEGLRNALAFLAASAVAVTAWVLLWKVTGKHEAATALFTSLAFAAAATALYLQHRSIAETKRDVERTAVALEGAQRVQAIQAALLEHAAYINKVNVKANVSQGSMAKKATIRDGFDEADDVLNRRMEHLGGWESLAPGKP